MIFSSSVLSIKSPIHKNYAGLQADVQFAFEPNDAHSAHITCPLSRGLSICCRLNKSKFSNQHDKVTHSLTSSNNTDGKANLAGLLVGLCARWSALVRKSFQSNTIYKKLMTTWKLSSDSPQAMYCSHNRKFKSHHRCQATAEQGEDCLASDNTA